MKLIIATVDFSRDSINAAEYAADLAATLSAELCILHMFRITPAAGETPMTERVFDEIQESAIEGLLGLKKSLFGRTGGNISVAFDMESGSIKSRLDNFCRRKNPWLVVSAGTVPSLPYPLIVVPANARFHPIRRIGVACDLGHIIDEMPVGFFKDLQEAFQARFDLLYVNKEQRKEPNAAGLKVLMEQVQDLNADFHFFTQDKLEDGINKLVEDCAIDLLLVLPQDHFFLEFHRSQSKKLILHCPIPVLAVHY